MFVPARCRFLLPEQPGAFPEQGRTCPEQSENHAGAIWEHALIAQAQS